MSMKERFDYWVLVAEEWILMFVPPVALIAVVIMRVMSLAGEVAATSFLKN